METGTVFSIEEFSTYDGPGIRMTVFLKGCPLRCMWCHNPEGQEFKLQVIRSENGCLKCGKCMEKGEEITGFPCLVKESISVCPRNLVRMCGISYTSKQLIDTIRKNAELLNASGGGVTFSGGEPLSQPDFLKECLEGLSGVTNRALQTTGYAPAKTFRRVLKSCDYVLYDLKLINSQKHKNYTGVFNEIILENFQYLVTCGIPFYVRIPLIPQVNDTAENIEQTAAFLKENRVHYAELLPYNKMAGGKYAMLGRRYQVDFDQQREPEVHREIFSKYDIEVRTL